MKKRKVGIIASGGDGSGMNACVYYLTKHFIDGGFEVVHFEGGYEGLCNNTKVEISLQKLLNNINRGGCVIKCGRSPQYMTEQGLKKAAKTFAKNALECVVVIGGNGSLKGIADGTPYGMNFIGIPATIDNDVFYTTYSIGYDSAANANIQLIKAIKNSCSASNKVPIVEIMGRDCGKLTLASAIGSGADICVVKEVPKTVESVLKEIKALKENGKNDILLVCAEKNIDLTILETEAAKIMGQEVRLFINSYAQRGPDTSAFDRILAATFAYEAFKLACDKKYSVAVGSSLGKPFAMDIEKALAKQNNFDIGLYNSLYK